MVDYKNFELKCYEFLKTKFEEVIWLSRISYSPIDFECKIGSQSFLIEAKYTETKKIRLLPSQRKADGVVINDGENITLLWKKDFKDKVTYDNMQIIKISETNKHILDELKQLKMETYDSVITRMINNFMKT